MHRPPCRRDKKFSPPVCEDTEYPHFDPALVNRYQLCIDVHVCNDLMALVLAVPNGEQFIRSIGV